jgi:hypothetical protein
MQGYLSHLAAQVTETRTSLDERVKFLSDYDTATPWMNAIPGGAAVKVTADPGGRHHATGIGGDDHGEARR